MDDVVVTLRRFNRSYTQRIGVLDDSFLGSGRPLGPSRLLFEIGPAGASVNSQNPSNWPAATVARSIAADPARRTPAVAGKIRVCWS